MNSKINQMSTGGNYQLRRRRDDDDDDGTGNTNGVSEIEEHDNSSELFEINHVVAHAGFPMTGIKEEMDIEIEGSLFSFDVNKGNDCVYVGVGKSESSMNAVCWALKYALHSDSTILYLIHVFPETHYIPSPLGRIPKSQVSPEQVQSYMEQERDKRRQLLQKYLNLCSASKVKVETVLIESDNVAKALLDLIPILNIRRLVLGTTKSSLRKSRSKRSGGIADHILQATTDEACEIDIICEGKKLSVSDSPTPPSPPPRGPQGTHKLPQMKAQSSDSFSCMCFKTPNVR